MPFSSPHISRARCGPVTGSVNLDRVLLVLDLLHQPPLQVARGILSHSCTTLPSIQGTCPSRSPQVPIQT